jgi:hypothetical protein
VRLVAHHLGVVPLNEEAAAEEAAKIAGYQANSGDVRLDGGFWFGQKNGETMPYMNPVSTAFCMQALVLWEMHCENRWQFELDHLI